MRCVCYRVLHSGLSGPLTHKKKKDPDLRFNLKKAVRKSLFAQRIIS